eukprot:COSAG02_NODE_46671_length_347_cov_0.625000_1_plen_79_part_10
MQRRRFHQLCSHLDPAAELLRASVAPRHSPAAVTSRQQTFQGIHADDTATLAEHYSRFGFVIIKGVLSRDEAQSLLRTT